MPFIFLLSLYFILFLYGPFTIHSMTIFLSILCSFSFSIIFYEDYAERYGWPCWGVFKKNQLSVLSIGAGLSLPFSLVVGGLHGFFLSGFIAVVIGFINGVSFMYSVHMGAINPKILQIIIILGFTISFVWVSLIWWQF